MNQMSNDRNQIRLDPHRMIGKLNEWNPEFFFTDFDLADCVGSLDCVYWLCGDVDVELFAQMLVVENTCDGSLGLLFWWFRLLLCFRLLFWKEVTLFLTKTEECICWRKLCVSVITHFKLTLTHFNAFRLTPNGCTHLEKRGKALYSAETILLRMSFSMVELDSQWLERLNQVVARSWFNYRITSQTIIDLKSCQCDEVSI